MKHTAILIALIVAVGFVLFVVINGAIVAYSGTPIPAPAIDRRPQMIGTGRPLTYVVMGDSTAVAQGATYQEGFAWGSAHHLAADYAVSFVNVGVSGARVHDVLTQQLPQAVEYTPGIVLIAVGANDVTHLTSSSSARSAMRSVVAQLRAANPAVKIVLTGAPAMDTVTRFPWAVQQVALQRVRSLNAAFMQVAKQEHLIFAPIADQTRAAFRDNPSLFAQDNFHPTGAGYALWTPIINHALDDALAE